MLAYTDLILGLIRLGWMAVQTEHEGRHNGGKMADEAIEAAERIAMRLRFLAHLGYAKNKTSSMTNAQWAALSFFNNANRFSRTLQSFAAFHSATVGSTSQTIDRLVKKELLLRVADKIDGRRARFDLTDEARKLAKSGPPETLLGPLSSLSAAKIAELESTLQDVLLTVLEDMNTSILGRCKDCRFRKEHFSVDKNGTGHFCAKFSEILTKRDTELECVHFGPCDPVSEAQSTIA